MSYSVFYNSFRADIADQKWENFDTVMHDALENKKKIEEFQKKDFDEYDIDEELIYNPKLKVEYEKERAEIIKAKSSAEQGSQVLESQNPISQSEILYYIENQTPMESDTVVPLMIELDLLFGGKMTSYNSALDPISQAETTLKILFPELDLRENRELEKNDCVFIFKHFDEIDARFKAHEKELLENNNLDIFGGSESELAQWKNEMKSYLLRLYPVVEEIITENAQFFNWTDSSGYPDDSILKERAKKHIEKIKNNPIMIIPLQDYGK